MFASVTSQVGDGLTRLTEQAFTLPNDLVYRRHGLIFGARLAATATRLEVTDAVFARNLRNFTRQCVFHALLLGHISADDLRESTDVWALVTAGGSPSAGASPARMFEFATRLPAAATGATPIDREIVTCRDGAGRLNAAWAAEITRAGTLFGRRIFPDARTQALARAELLAALPAAHDFLIGASRSAAEILRQQMVLNAVHDAGEQWAAEAGNTAALQTYTEARAEAQTAAAYRAIGRQAETWVPLLRIVFECLYVGAFPLAVLLMLTPAGLTIFRSYVTGLIWLQSWGPLYAILHRISMGEAAERMQAAALMPDGDVGISLVAQAGIRAVAADVAVMSGYLSMSVPFLAAALAYGLSKATVLATSVLAVGQDAATSAAHEGTTGNLSLANTQWDTHRFASQEGRQLRTSMHVDTDRYTGYAPAGAGLHGDPGRHRGGRHGECHEPGAGGGGAALGIARGLARGARRRGALDGPELGRAGGDGADGRGHRFDAAGGAVLARCEHRHRPRSRGHRERERPGAGTGIARREARRTRTPDEGPGNDPDRRSLVRRRAGLRAPHRRQRYRHVAGADGRDGSLEPHAGVRPPAWRDRPLVAGPGGVQALFDING